MAPIDILVTRDLEPELLDSIRAVDSRIRVHVLSENERLLLRGERLPAGVAADEAERSLRDKLASVRIAIGWADLTGVWLSCAPHLDWIHLTGAGVDRLRGTPLFASERVLLTNSSGVSAAAIGEYILMAMLLLAKRAPRYLRQQREHVWARHQGAELRGRTLGIVGLGAIGEAAAQRAAAFDMRVVAIRRSIPAPCARAGIERLLPPASLHELLRESDYVVLSVPLTNETEGLIGEAEFRAMKPGAVLINVARGRVIDQTALIGALQSGRLGGAALDVHDPEPLPADSPLWDLDRVILTPHVSGSAGRHNERIAELFCENLRRYVAGEPLRNVVDRARAY